MRDFGPVVLSEALLVARRQAHLPYGAIMRTMYYMRHFCRGEASVIPRVNPKPYADAEKGGAALRAFFKLSDLWDLNQAQQQRLLGNPGRSTLARWKAKAADGKDVDIGADRLERMSYLLGVHKALNILYTRPELAARWLHHLNKDSYFGDRAPLEFMLRGGAVVDLYRVRSYLDDMLGGTG
jgi:hypothetical protein